MGTIYRGFNASKVQIAGTKDFTGTMNLLTSSSCVQSVLVTQLISSAKLSTTDLDGIFSKCPRSVDFAENCLAGVMSSCGKSIIVTVHDMP